MQASISLVKGLSAGRTARHEARRPVPCVVALTARPEEATAVAPASLASRLASATAAACAAVVLASAGPAFAGAARLPPLDNDPNRCDRAFVGNTIGQANGVSDKILDLRSCKLAGKNLAGKTLSGGLLADGDFSNTNLTEAILSKVYAAGASFKGANFSSAVLDRVEFARADMSGAKFYNAVITGSTYTGTVFTGADFTDALIGGEDAKRLCANPTVTGTTRDQVGCKD